MYFRKSRNLKNYIPIDGRQVDWKFGGVKMFDLETYDGRDLYDKIEYNRKRKCKSYDNYFMGFCDNMKRIY
ncbi:hypothetical protein SAMN02745751_01915 [Dethiosulfatibacter aminovorans DSM 17477]|uniref:Uncharacterized protein n=1 Tax=Dethiosulfatibacter aminovorans DSM 17477 TaxID=1121476 RepID=A0A1M6H4J3_9FIRM|nr:hypothetical protein SAMN02745751_01915 [Dethiosulfatibacter aminovorans DSM 17477]